MDRKKYKQLRVLLTLFVSALVAVAVMRSSYLLASVGIVTGIFVTLILRSHVKVKTDERESVVQEKAARMAYGIFAPTMGVSALLLLLPTKSGLAVFSRGEFAYIESFGIVFAYVTLFLITLYGISYHYYNKKYGGSSDEE